MRVRVDADRCAGHGVCTTVCPDVFTLSDDGYAVVTQEKVPTEFGDLVQQAVSQCPEHAITAITD